MVDGPDGAEEVFAGEGFEERAFAYAVVERLVRADCLIGPPADEQQSELRAGDVVDVAGFGESA